VISKNRLAVAAISAGLLTSLLGMGAAQADPSGTPSPRALVGVGSDTTTNVMNAIANDVQIGGVKQIGSFDATGSATINTGKSGCSAVARPNGSGAGRSALVASLNSATQCIQFSRSSSEDLTAINPSLTYVPLATDDVDFAITSTSVVPRSLSKADLTAIYHCNASYVGTGPVYNFTPVLPQAGSGTRSFWEGYVGITDADVNANVYKCLINGTRNGTPIEEQTGTALDDKSLMPFSVGQYNAQVDGVIPDRRGNAVIGVIDNTLPSVTSSTFANQREVYNVIPSADTNVDPWKTVFVGGSSLVCQQTNDIITYGFLVDAAKCGTTSDATAAQH
jgi:ABC-type phosphate transport system substrate-binding protein